MVGPRVLSCNALGDLVFQFLYDVASNFKIAIPPCTFKRNQSQKHPWGYFVFFLQKTELPLINETAIVFIFFFSET